MRKTFLYLRRTPHRSDALLGVQVNTKDTKVTKEVQRRFEKFELSCKKNLRVEVQDYLKISSELLSVLRVLCVKKNLHRRLA